MLNKRLLFLLLGGLTSYCNELLAPLSEAALQSMMLNDAAPKLIEPAWQLAEQVEARVGAAEQLAGQTKSTLKRIKSQVDRLLKNGWAWVAALVGGSWFIMEKKKQESKICAQVLGALNQPLGKCLRIYVEEYLSTKPLANNSSVNILTLDKDYVPLALKILAAPIMLPVKGVSFIYHKLSTPHNWDPQAFCGNPIAAAAAVGGAAVVSDRYSFAALVKQALRYDTEGLLAPLLAEKRFPLIKNILDHANGGEEIVANIIKAIKLAATALATKRSFTKENDAVRSLEFNLKEVLPAEFSYFARQKLDLPKKKK